MSDLEDAMNDWDIGSGLALDGATAEITKSSFGFNNDIVAGRVFWNVEFTPLDGSDPIEQSFSLGDGWEASKDGEQLLSESGKPKKINDSTGFGIWLNSCIKVLGSKERAAEVIGRARYGPSWLGTMWTVGSFKRTVKNPSTGVEKEGIAWIATEHHGENPLSGSSDAKADSKPAASKATSRVGGGAKAAAGPPDGVSEELWEALIEKALEFDNHDDFSDAAMDVDGVDGNKAAAKAIMGSKKGSVWEAAEKRRAADSE